MYSYYGLKSMKFNPPRKLSMMITLLQLSQMVIGLILNLYAVYVKSNNYINYFTNYCDADTV